MQLILKKIFKNRQLFLAVVCWLFVAFALTMICSLVYLVVQQSIRITANDPQIQIAEDVSSALDQGTAMQDIASGLIPVDIGSSLDSYLVIFDDNGSPVMGSGRLAGQLPSLPIGVFDSVRTHGEDRFTWQPQYGVRSAVVVSAYKSQTANGFVLVGRSLREVEHWESALVWLVTIVWLALLITSAVFSLVLYYCWRWFN